MTGPSRRVTVPLVARRYRLGLASAVAAVTLCASVAAMPDGGPSGPLAPVSDDLLHGVAYATLALTLVYATVEWARTPVRRVAAVLAVAIGYGVLIEFVQAPLPTRQYSTADVGANAAGALLGSAWVTCERWVRYRPLDARDPDRRPAVRREE